MGNETRKTNKARGLEFIEKYFQGKVIDIGGGSDPVIPDAKVFDLKDGDAQYISKYEKREYYDCVHSSHCLEHMVDVPSALSQWWTLVKVGGYMIITVPHEDLYEQRIWPSIFNDDHKATFRLNQKDSWSQVSYDLAEISASLNNVKILDAQIQDNGYDYNLQYNKISPKYRKIYRWQFSKNTIKRRLGELLYKLFYQNHYANHNTFGGLPIDQTSSNALAQIQIILQKIK